MKKWISYVMLLTVVTHLFYSSGYLLDYYINTDFYKTNCINQDKPELHCDGKCILAQKILAAKKQQGEEKKDFSMPASMEYLVACFYTEFNFSLILSKPQSTWVDSKPQSVITDSFIPPEYVVA